MHKQKPIVQVPKPTTEVKKSDSQLLTQREAVFQEVMKVLKQEKITLASKQAAKTVLKETHIKSVVAALSVGFKSKAIALKDTESNKKKISDAKALEAYVIGLLNNWLRRDDRLNGNGDKVQPK